MTEGFTDWPFFAQGRRERGHLLEVDSAAGRGEGKGGELTVEGLDPTGRFKNHYPRRGLLSEGETVKHMESGTGVCSISGTNCSCPWRGKVLAGGT